METTGRQTTVLFADVSGSTTLYESAGDVTAHQAITGCLDKLRDIVEKAGGRVVKTIGDEVMALFGTPDAAAGAAAAMQHAIDALPPVSGTKLGLRIGFHCGTVIQQDGDVFGDTVNLASRLTGQAVKGQIVTSHDTLALLGPIYRGSTRKLYTIQVKGRVEEVGLCELIWRQSDDATTFATKRPEPQTKPVVLRLRYRGAELVRRREADSVTLGREQSCGLVVPDSMASRQHCTVERRGDKFVLRDHSTNGTYVTTEGDQEIVLRREEVTLRLRGWIALGQSRAATEEVVEYLCD